ncbi:MAG: PIG-L deacetylase family protein [Promethearchaeota archaeon]
MKIVILEPHPDDLLFGPGPIIFEWINQGHEIHVITVTDGRACYRGGKDVYTPDVISFTEDNVADMRLNEAKKTVDFLGIPKKHLHLLKIHDNKARKHIKEGIEKVKPILEGVNRLVLPSDHNGHKDHQATHDIAIKAAIELQLTDIEYFVYFIPSYGKFNEDSKEKQIVFPINEDLKKKLFEWLDLYESQKKGKYSWKMYTRFIKIIKSTTYGRFTFDDIGKYYNF